VAARPLNLREYLAKRGFEVVQPTAALVGRWWRICLLDVFNYPPIKSLVPATVEIRKQPDEWAACHWPEKFSGRLHLTHHNDPISRNGLVTIICHEQAHAILAHEDRSDLETHGERFLYFEKLVEDKTGLPFKGMYSPEEIQALGRKLK
jgi:hypothetical protein